MVRKFFAVLLAAGLLAGCYAYPAGYAPYNAYPVTGGYQGYPSYAGYEGGKFVEQGGHERGRPGYFGDGRRGDDDHCRAGGPVARPGGFGGQPHGGGNFHGGGWFPSHH